MITYVARPVVGLFLSLVALNPVTGETDHSGDRGRHRSIGIFIHLLRLPEVQGELELSDDQVRQFTRLTSKTRFYGGKHREPTNATWRILNPTQRKRLSEIERQYVESDFFCKLLYLHDDVAEELQLSSEQIDLIKGIEEDITRKANQWLRALSKQNPNFLEQLDLQRRVQFLAQTEGRYRVPNILTAEQLTRWEDMQGEPFDLSAITDRRDRYFRNRLR